MLRMEDRRTHKKTAQVVKVNIVGLDQVKYGKFYATVRDLRVEGQKELVFSNLGSTSPLIPHGTGSIWKTSRASETVNRC
jgi:hypothetical protein